MAAKKVFEVSGYNGARMQQIADEAGISKASLHYYFRSKENLFDRIFDETMAEFIPLMSIWDDASEDWELKIRSYINKYFTFLKNKSLLFILREINRNPDLLLSRRKSKPKSKSIAYFEKLKSAGIIRDVNPTVIYLFLQSLCSYPLLNTTLIQMNLGMNDKEFEAFIDEYPNYVADFLINALKKQPKK